MLLRGAQYRHLVCHCAVPSTNMTSGVPGAQYCAASRSWIACSSLALAPRAAVPALGPRP
eukprot:3493850-Rhodomonas_salina.2